MHYNIIISKRALQEIDDALAYYTLHSTIAPSKFLDTLINTYNTLTANPFHRIRYKNVRGIKLVKFPYVLYYHVNETSKLIKILACFHEKQNPNKRP